jgi:hypothetical protein
VLTDLSGLGLALVLTCALSGASTAHAQQAPFINTWLVLGTFDNGPENAGLDADPIGEAEALPALGNEAAGRTWCYFDDRLFQRSYDSYQDLYSYLKLKRGEDIAAKLAYAHVYVYSPQAQEADLCVGADSAVRAWVNGAQVLRETIDAPYRDMLVAPVQLQEGWNRLLLKVGNRQAGRLGFYARLAANDDSAVPGLIYAVNPPGGALAVSTGAMPDAGPATLPAAFRAWPYVGARPLETFDAADEIGAYAHRKPHFTLHASDFALLAEGGVAPYAWALATGALPPGVELRPDGTFGGTVAADAPEGDYPFTVRVTDAAGATAEKALSIAVHERPNLWYEQSRLVALVHAPESLPVEDMPLLARTMKAQGYSIGMMISYNNGDMKYRWPNQFEPDHPDTIGQMKAALEAEGLRAGMYMGNLIGPNHGGDDGALLMVQEAIERYHPAAFWFDWASSPTPDGYISMDALYSMIRTLSPDTLIVLNGVVTLYQCDWDVICLEGWGAWGKNHWGLFPFPIEWAKAAPVETWRLVTDPEFSYTEGLLPDWREYLRLQIAIAGSGFVANIDHSPAIAQKYSHLSDSRVFQAHQEMAAWANPPGLPPLHESYTWVNPGPLGQSEWGYDLLNLPRTALYLHMLQTPLGKTGMPADGRLQIGPLAVPVRQATWMNQGQAVPFVQTPEGVSLDLSGVTADPVDTILKLELAQPYPAFDKASIPAPHAVPPGNLASHKRARLLSLDGSHGLIPSGFALARYGVDGLRATWAQGAYEWPWTYEVDLGQAYPVDRIVVHFGSGWATEYEVRVSPDGVDWESVAHETGCQGGTVECVLAPRATQYVRVMGIKPDGPDQEGSQMSISELEVYSAESQQAGPR